MACSSSFSPSFPTHIASSSSSSSVAAYCATSANRNAPSSAPQVLFVGYANVHKDHNTTTTSNAPMAPAPAPAPDHLQKKQKQKQKQYRSSFTEEKAKQLRRKTAETYNFHDVMYHSAIASRLAFHHA